MKPLRFPMSSLIRRALPFAFVFLLATPSAALALGDWIGVEGSKWRQGQDGHGSIDGDLFNGTTFDFQDTLGLDKDDNTTMGRLWFHFGVTHLVFDYFDSTRSGSTTLTQSFVFNDTLYTAGQNLQSDFDFKLYQAQFLFTVANLKVVDVGVGFGLNEAKVRMEMNGSVGGQSDLDESVPYPTLAGYVTIKPAPAFHIKAELNILNATISGVTVDTLDARAQMEFYVAHVLGFFAGYRRYDIEAEDPDFGSFENHFKGPYAGIGLKF